MSSINIKLNFENNWMPCHKSTHLVLTIGFVICEPEMHNILCFDISHPDDGVEDIVSGQLEMYEAKQLRDFLNYALKDKNT
jgi:hypothetical protein